ncbi:hypothetical protein I3843_02G014300 [Carya illinoinensis]|nr:hypothetical protein I3843_02G014300 [Carya illinoinensis]
MRNGKEHPYTLTQCSSNPPSMDILSSCPDYLHGYYGINIGETEALCTSSTVNEIRENRPNP